MPEYHIDKKENIDIVTTYEVIRKKFSSAVESEKKKYPLTTREEMFVDVINELLGVLDYVTKSRY